MATLVKSRSCEETTEPEFIFKTFDRGNGVYVTLLEENREMIGHGTTGLCCFKMDHWYKITKKFCF